MKKKLITFSIITLLLLSFLTIFPSIGAISFDSSENGIVSLAVYDGKLYAGGTGEGKIFVYDGYYWNLSFDNSSSTTLIFSLTVYDGKLYAGSNLIYVYDGNYWNETSNTSITYISTLTEYNGKLYAGDYYNNTIFVFDGVNWSINYTFTTQKTEISIEYNNKLYVSGFGGEIYVYDEINWNLSYDTLDNGVESFVKYNDKLYASSRNAGIIHVYDGNNWNTSTTVTGIAYSLGIYDGKLYTGSTTMYVYDGNNWNISVTPTLPSFQSMLEYNGKFYVGNHNGGLIYEFDGVAWNENLNSPDKPTLINPIINYVNEDFNTSWLPTDWEELVYSGDGHWNLSNISFGLPYVIPYASASSLIYKSVIFNVSLFTPKITIPSMSYSVILDCDIYFRQYNSDEGYIRVWSENKTTLEETLEYFNMDILHSHITDYLDISNYSSLTDIQIEFHYTTNNNVYQDFFIIDNVKISNIYPSNISINTNLSVNVIERDDDIMSISFYWDNDTLIETISNITSYTNIQTSNLSLDYDTTYNWYVIANDSERQTRSNTFSFTTVLSEIPFPPITPTTIIYTYLVFILMIGFGIGIYILSKTKRKRFK